MKRLIALAAAIGIGATALFTSGASAAQHPVVATFAMPAVGCAPYTYYNPVVPGWEGSGQISATQSWSAGICTVTLYHYY